MLCLSGFELYSRWVPLLSAYARTSQANIFHLDEKAANCKTCKWLYGKFQLLIAHQLPENHSSSGKWVKFFGETWKGAEGGVGSLERVSLILIYIFMNSFIYTVFNLWITRSVKNFQISTMANFETDVYELLKLFDSSRQ